MRIPFAQIDAFADTPFAGNPAAVMPLSAWLDDAVLLDIAQENNLSETAFIVASDEDGVDFDLRWFTPGAEVALCGHATLASGHFVLSSDTARDRVRFRTRQAGMLEVARADRGYTLELPAWAPQPKAMPEIVAALTIVSPVETLWHDKGYALVVVADEAASISFDAGFGQQLQECRALVMGTLHHMDDAEIGRASQHDWGRAGADDSGQYAGLLQQLDAMAIQYVEGLDHFAFGAEMQTAVGQDAIDIEDHQPDSGRLLSGVALIVRHQITFARVRSWICSAPTSTPAASATSN